MICSRSRIDLTGVATGVTVVSEPYLSSAVGAAPVLNPSTSGAGLPGGGDGLREQTRPVDPFPSLPPSHVDRAAVAAWTHGSGRIDPKLLRGVDPSSSARRPSSFSAAASTPTSFAARPRASCNADLDLPAAASLSFPCVGP
jgi:hypothetical protein